MPRRATAPVVLVLTCGLALAAGLVAYRWWGSDERVIRSRLSELAAALSVGEGGREVAVVTRVAALRRYFAPDVEIRFGTEQVLSRDALVALLGRWTPPPGGLEVEFVDAAVTFDEADANAARIHLTATITSRDPQSGEDLIDAREATVGMEKRDGDWVVVAVESRDTLRRP